MACRQSRLLAAQQTSAIQQFFDVVVPVAIILTGFLQVQTAMYTAFRQAQQDSKLKIADVEQGFFYYMDFASSFGLPLATASSTRCLSRLSYCAIATVTVRAHARTNALSTPPPHPTLPSQ